MSEIIARESQALEQDAIVTLFELDATAYGEGILRWCNETSENGQPVSFGGHQHLPLPIEASGFRWSGQGTLPQPRLLISAMELAFLSLVITADDLLGAPVRRLRTYRRHLDDGSDPDPEALFPVDHYVIERKSGQTRTQFEFTLSAPMDQEGKMIPARQVLRDTCTHRYRWWDGTQYQYEGVTCPYAGSGAWRADGTPTTAANDRCGNRRRDCQLRFGKNNPLPTRAFPGVGRF